MKKTVKIEGMSCEHCVKSVETALNSLEGIASVKVNLDKKEAVIEAVDVEDKDIKQTIDDIGFEVVGIE